MEGWIIKVIQKAGKNQETSSTKRQRVLVVGAGASGMMAAIQAAKNGAKVTVLEQNDRAGRKLAATGNGRCNFSNVDFPRDAYRGGNPGFVRQAQKEFGLQETLRFFSSLGLVPVEEEGRLYPRSMQAQSVVDLLRREMDRLGVTCKYREHVTSVQRICKSIDQAVRDGDSDGFMVTTDTWRYEADTVVLSCGSKASGISGSGEDGYSLAKSLGHTVIEPLPALVPLALSGSKFSSWAGVRTRGRITLLIDGAAAAAETGELQLTDYGISGIPVLMISRYATKSLEEGKRVTVRLDFLPEIREEDLQDFWRLRKEACPDKNDRELLVGVFPDKLIRVLTAQKDLLSSMKAFVLTVDKALSFSHAQVCQGGVDTDEIVPDTMESRLCPGLYITGELLDVDGTCGGFNLQWAWTSGALAGKAAANRWKNSPFSTRA